MTDLFNRIPLPAFNLIDDYECGDGTYMLIYGNCDIDSYNKYCELIESRGFIKTDSSEIDGNVHNTFTGELFIHTYFTPADGKTRIIVSEDIPVYKTKPEFTGNTNSVLWQFEIDHSLIDCGMCYAVRCDDGSFFVIDSAHFYSVRDDIRIIEFLRKISGENKPRVSGWYFSHAHEDHIGKFLSLLKYYDDLVSIDTLYYNFPSENRADIPWEIQVKNLTEEFRKEVSNKKNINKVKLHTGMRFAVKNLLFTVLCTHEDVFPCSTSDFNNTSTVIKMECGETAVLFPGDASVESDKIMTERYRDALKCDVIQVSHHGHTGCSPEFYKRAGAKCALFPVTVIKFEEEWPRQESNRTVADIADEYYIASNGTAEIPLPYKTGNTKVWPDETFEDFNGIYQLWSYEYTEEYKNKLYEEYLKRSKL